ncbi:MAG TPA: ATP-binding cassette domain-containing protein [Burkholderiaceae bacterium]|nr:ATP-binding cassette domain-containing protein [Burkholderiaceae bacterium]
MQAPLLQVQGLVKRYRRGWPRAQTTFELRADLRVDGPGVVGVMGANGTGKTTLFELITGGNAPTEGRVLVAGQDIHQVRHDQRDRLALHYHQSYQLRRFRRTRPKFLLEAARATEPVVHLFDEPQFNAQDGYIGFMLDFFQRLRNSGKVVFLCLHPNEPVHLDILEAACERFVFVEKDAARISRLREAATLRELAAWPAVASYLGSLLAARQPA